MKTNGDIINAVLSELKKVKGKEMCCDGLCAFVEHVRLKGMITFNERNHFINIIHKYRDKYGLPNRQHGVWFFPMYEVAPRIKYLKKILKDKDLEKGPFNNRIFW